MNGKWFYSADGAQQTGPVAKEEIERKLTQGELDAKTLVWTETMAEWRPATDLPDLTWERPVVPPPLPVRAPPPLPRKTKLRAAAPPHLDRIEIRPRRQRNAILAAAGALFFGGGGLLMILAPETETDQWAGLAGLVFSGFIFYATLRLWHRRTSMVLTPEHLEQVTIYGAAVIPWADVEQVSAFSYLGQKLIGVKLRTYDNYLANISQELAGALTKMLPVMRLAAKGISMVPGAAQGMTLLTLWSKLDGVAEPAEALKEFGKVGDLAGYLLASRKTMGYDLAFSWADFDRPADNLAGLIEQYRAAAA